ncbi:MAG: carbamoyl phosphate synthase small subunit, partial [Planctomycetaceae bacterium]|nr:carbamoyl phosphate synthase small subunit [Planctomycetaceae bacterium]
LVKEVVPEKSSAWTEGLSELGIPFGSSYESATAETAAGNGQPHVVAIDYGMKWNIPRHLTQIGCRVTIVPGTANTEEILAQKPDGVFLANGPGDPRPLTDAIETIRELVQQKPVFGICLGQQLLGLALGGEIFKLKFGHRGANQPVLNKATGRVEITAQNHGFAIEEKSLPSYVEVTHINLNDRTIEGLKHRELPAFGVQYHPEAAAGPHDSHYLFRQFYESMTA